MKRDQALLDAYARYLLMPLYHNGYHFWRNPNNVLRGLVRWVNPFTHELEGEEDQEIWSWSSRITSPDHRNECWAVPDKSYIGWRHFTLAEFSRRVKEDEEFRSFVRLRR